MSIVTKTGDDGKSRFLNRVEAKDGPLLEAVGAIDELSAVIQIVGLRDIATDLWGIMGDLAYEVRFMKYDLRTTFFENEIERMEKALPKISKFIVFKTKKSQRLNWARTVARRAERRIVGLSKHQEVDKEVLKYFNRLSDYLFCLSRYK